jgi:8-oxo-dGTP pyrophosphatase MutT (NUDIX family)
MTKEMPDWWYRQSAVVPYRRGTNGLEVLLITSRKRKRWVLPKGVIEPDMTPSASEPRKGGRRPASRERSTIRRLAFTSTTSGAEPAQSTRS